MIRNSLLLVSAMLLACVVGLMGDSKLTAPRVRGHPRMIRNSFFRVSALLLALVLGLGNTNMCIYIYKYICSSGEKACENNLKQFLAYFGFLSAFVVGLRGDSKIATPRVKGHPRMIRNSLSRVSAMLLAFVVGLVGDSKIATPRERGHPRMIRNSLLRVSAMLLAFVVGRVGFKNSYSSGEGASENDSKQPVAYFGFLPTSVVGLEGDSKISTPRARGGHPKIIQNMLLARFGSVACICHRSRAVIQK